MNPHTIYASYQLSMNLNKKLPVRANLTIPSANLTIPSANLTIPSVNLTIPNVNFT